MAQKSEYVRMAFGPEPVLRKGDGQARKSDHSNRATLEQFDRERMGLAAKE